MTAPICEDKGLLQEWAPECRLISQIPVRAQRGIFSQDLKLTCVDVCPEFLTLGTNCGLIYWYCRASSQLERLRFENTNCSVTCVKIVSTVDFMVAAGTDIGNITVFQIPKDHPDTLPDALKPKKKQVERFTINGLHKNRVTCLEWSPNGMKLFSGDMSGEVVLTSIDFNMHLSKSSEMLNEKFEIVQLSYLQNCLLISSTYRTIICDGANNWKVSQLGSKERKILDKFGATFCKFSHGTVVYASRPGQRLWLADKAGNVQQTLIFKGAIQSSHHSIPILNPTQLRRSTDQHFGKLLQFGDDRLVCYQSEGLFVLHPGAISVAASLFNIRKIIDVAVCKDEIFILEGERSLIRISHEPSLFAMDDISDKIDRRKSFNFDELANKIKDTAIGSFKKMASDLIAPAEKISPPTIADEALNLPPVENTEEDLSVAAFPDLNVEVHESIDESANMCPTNRRNSPKSIASCSKTEPEEEIVFRPVKKRKPKKLHQLVQQVTGQDVESDTSEDRLVCGVANDVTLSEESPTSWSQSQSSYSVLRDIGSLIPSSIRLQAEMSRTPEDIDTCDSASEKLVLTPNLFQEEQSKIFKRLANQEMSMLDSFNSERTENMSISINLTPSSSASSKLSDLTSENVSMVSECEPRVETQTAQPPRHDIECLPPSNETSSLSSGNSQNASLCTSSSAGRQWNKEVILSQMLGLDFQDPLNRRRKVDETECREEANQDCTKLGEECPTPLVETLESDENNVLLPESNQGLARGVNDCNHVEKSSESTVGPLTSIDGLSYGPPSGSSMLSSCNPSLDLNTGLTVLNNPPAVVVEKSDRWLQYETPEGLKLITMCNNYVMCIDAQERVFYSRLSGISPNWVLLDYSAAQASVSPDAQIVWIQNSNAVMALLNPSPTGPFSEETIEITNSAMLSFSVDSECAYLIRSNGRIICQKNLGRYPCGKSEDVFCPWQVKYVICHKGVVFAITNDDLLIYRPTSNSSFDIIKTPSRVTVSIAVGPLNLLWIVDDHNNIYFSDNFCEDEPDWWQILISEYIFQNSPSKFLNLHNQVKMGAKWSVHSTPKITCVAANESSIWIYNKLASNVVVCKSDFTGIRWQHLPHASKIKFKMISVEGAFEEKGHIWLLSVQGDIFCANPTFPSNIRSVEEPSTSDVVCIAAALDTLWVLTAEGTVHARLGLSVAGMPGSVWRQLRLPQFTDTRVVWISCGCDASWCVEKTGKVFLSLAPPHDMSTSEFDAAWLEVDGNPKDCAVFVKVFAGPHMHMVWALDSKRQIYVREGIFPHYPIGTGWVHVGGIAAVQLTVSGTGVWAITPTQQIFRRYGISEKNYIGDYWRQVSGAVVTASATFDDQLWGVRHDGCVSQMLKKNISLAKPESNRCVSIGDDDWLVVEES